jgi:hypothetical protein
VYRVRYLQWFNTVDVGTLFTINRTTDFEVAATKEAVPSNSHRVHVAEAQLSYARDTQRYQRPT